ncbi:MAG: NAD(P)-dependent oxidoreductase [Actinobacteria bacterium]|nr:MAG: NAD(P)-dependent oxidoreductase [Actinomycetota bacterium]
MPSIAFFGRGAVGSGRAARLLEAGHDLVLWNRSVARTRELVARGAALADTPADAARQAEVVITMVADPVALRETTEGPDGVLAGIREGAALVQMSTVDPAAISRLAAHLPDGVGLLDAPVLGSLPEAESGTLHIFVGGPARLIERWTPMLSILGRPVPVGAAGAGTAAKLVVNATAFGVLAVLGESLALAHGLGLSRDAAYAALAQTPLAKQVERRRPAVDADDYPPQFALALARKDADLVANAAAAAGLALPVTIASGAWLAAAEESGRGEQDYSAVLAQILQNAPRGRLR